MNKFTPDKELIDFYLSGNEIGFDLLIEKHKKFVFQFINSKIRDVDISNDIFQETFIKVIICLKSNKYNDNGKFISWVIRIANNLVMDHFRNQEKKPMFYNNYQTVLLNNYPEPPSQLEEIIAIEYNFSKIKNLIENLLPEQREILRMRFYEEKTFREIAELDRISINTALGRFRYAIENLRKEIIKQNIVFQ